MQYYTEDLIKEINNKPDCNFIACAVTYLQVIGINATINRMKAYGIKLSGFILIFEHPTTGRVLKETDFDLNGTDIVAIDYCNKYRELATKPLRNRLLAVSESGKDNGTDFIHILWTGIDYRWYEILSKVNPKKQIRFILIDDGDGSYINQFSNELYMELYEKGDTLSKRMKAYIRVTIREVTKSLLVRNLQNRDRLIDNRIFHVDKDGRYIPNTHISEFYKNAFREQGSGIDKSIIEKCENAVLFNTQCLFENKMSDGKTDLELYRSVSECAKTLGLKVALKPHPRELDLKKYSDFNIDIIPANITQEALIANTTEKPACVISIFSSTLLNAYGIFDIPVISLAKIFIKTGVSSTVEAQLKDYIKRYEKNFIFPETVDELKVALEKIVKEKTICQE